MREEVKTHNLRDRFGSRAYHLNIIGFHEGQLKPDELITECWRYLNVVRKLTEKGKEGKNFLNS
jgi:hypothetical protein